MLLAYPEMGLYRHDMYDSMYVCMYVTSSKLSKQWKKTFKVSPPTKIGKG
jgi:hypothetical protein